MDGYGLLALPASRPADAGLFSSRAVRRTAAHCHAAGAELGAGQPCRRFGESGG